MKNIRQSIDTYLTDNINIEEKYFENLLIDFDDDYVYLMYSYFLLKKNSVQKAEKIFNIVGLRTDEYSHVLLIEALFLYYRDNEDQKAIEKLKQSISVDPSNKWSFLELFYLLVGKKDYEAFGYLEEAIKIDENFNEAIYARVLYYDSINNCSDVISEILKIPQTYINAYILNTLAFAYYNCFEVDNATKIAKASLEYEETDRAFYLLGTIASDNEDYTLALYNFNQSLEKNENQKDVLNSKAWALFDTNKFDEAEYIFLQVLQFDFDQESFNQIIQFYLETENFESVDLFIKESKLKNGKNYMNDTYKIIYLHLINDGKFEFYLNEFMKTYSELEHSWFNDVFSQYSSKH